MSAINSDPDSGGALIDTDKIDPDFIRLWYVKKFNRRPEIVVADSVTTLSDIVVEAWKAILVSVRVMEKDQNLSNFRSLTVFHNRSFNLFKIWVHYDIFWTKSFIIQCTSFTTYS